MGKVIFSLSLKNGNLYYRDFEKENGKTIYTSFDSSDKIAWNLNENADITGLSGIDYIGNCKFLSKEPAKKAYNKSTSNDSIKTIGKIEDVFFVNDSNILFKKAKATGIPIAANRSKTPKLKVRL